MSVRVVAGSFRGRVLSTPQGMATRPTAGRAREAMFSILGNIEGAEVLDLYAGSGALGFEALSRGAARAMFVEHERRALACLRENVEKLEVSARAVIVAERAEALARRLEASRRFDLVFCDPPWKNLDKALSALSVLRAHFATDVRVVLEHPATLAPELPGFHSRDQRRWGDTGASFFEPDAG